MMTLEFHEVKDHRSINRSPEIPSLRVYSIQFIYRGPKYREMSKLYIFFTRSGAILR